MIRPHERPSEGPLARRAAEMQALVPVIRTARLVLRAPRIEDFGTFAAIAGSDRSAGMGGPMTRETAWAEFMQMTGTWYLRGHGSWTIEARATGATLGFVLIGFEPGDREPELGYMLTEEAEGQGIAAEAARAARDHGFGEMGLASLVSYVEPANDRSRRVAEGLGAMRDRAAEAELDPGDAALVYRHRPDAAPDTALPESRP